MSLIIIACLLLGALAGLLSGLLGIGGGLVIVPALAWLLPLAGVQEELVMPMALATSLATICFTGSSSMWAHHRRGNIPWKVARYLVPGMILGGLLGAQVAALLSPFWLKRLFAAFLFFSAARMIWSKVPKGEGRTELALPWALGLGMAVGTLSSLLGIGGGVLMVPLLTWLGVALTAAVATAAVNTLAVALSGSLSYAWLGAGQPGLPEGSLGYIYLPALLALLPGAFVMAQVGVRLLSRIPAPLMRKLFALLLLAVGLEMLLN
ncbi:sulfite exporter TauE/SafE family protein [Gallaecimonas sp. GXIMD4217]|uniref:sulfite exporter TauE/SafE family protein n=1 Tax=Gallaecimonas sp. GXIMD4217 TaxID=3131927 RepID=UPI00311ADBD5